jgi:signal transduction histidine kinase
MGRGIMGGSLKSQVAQTRAMGDLAVKVLHGTPADAIPLSTPDLNVSEIDWRQLRRWGISESRVPAGTIVSYREPSVWDRYRVYILVAATALVAQTALIAGLLLQGARRRKAEARVRAREADLRVSYRRIRDLGGRLLSAQDAERSRIARELHDDIGQQLMLLTIDLDLLGNGGRHDAATLARGALGRAHGIANSLRDLSHRLHPAKLRLIGLVPALASLQREATSADTAVTFTHENVPAVIPPDVTLCLYRVAQEALHNASKYSQARAVSMNLAGGAGGLVLKVTDDGVGFDVEAVMERGLGLVSMRERVEAFGGALDVRSSPGAGTSIAAVVPCQGATPAANVTRQLETRI